MQESSIVQEYMRRAEERGHARGLEQGIVRGHASGQITNAVDTVLILLGDQFQPDAVAALKPRLEKIADLNQLKRLIREAPRAESLEAFAENLPDS